MARNPRPVAVAKAPKAIPNDEFSSPVFGSAWLPRLCLGFLTSEVDSEVDTEALVDAKAERLADVLNEVEVLVLSEILKNTDVEADSDTEAEALAEAEADADALALCHSLNDTDSLV